MHDEGIRSNSQVLLARNWHGVTDLQPASYVCGHCGESTGTSQGFKYSNHVHCVYLCGHCGQPSYVPHACVDDRVPGAMFGANVPNLTDEVADLYRQARKCMSDRCWTAAAMCCRKLILNVAHQCGAKPQDLGRFVDAVKFLQTSGHVPPAWHKLADEVRQRGNEANHVLPNTTQEAAERVMRITAFILQSAFPESLESEDEGA